MTHDTYSISARHGKYPHSKGGGATVYIRTGHYTERQLLVLVRVVHTVNCPKPRLVEKWRQPPTKPQAPPISKEQCSSEPARPLEAAQSVPVPAAPKGPFWRLHAAIEGIRAAVQKALYHEE